MTLWQVSPSLTHDKELYHGDIPSFSIPFETDDDASSLSSLSSASGSSSSSSYSSSCGSSSSSLFEEDDEPLLVRKDPRDAYHHQHQHYHHQQQPQTPMKPFKSFYVSKLVDPGSPKDVRCVEEEDTDSVTTYDDDGVFGTYYGYGPTVCLDHASCTTHEDDDDTRFSSYDGLLLNDCFVGTSNHHHHQQQQQQQPHEFGRRWGEGEPPYYESDNDDTYESDEPSSYSSHYASDHNDDERDTNHSDDNGLIDASQSHEEFDEPERIRRERNSIHVSISAYKHALSHILQLYQPRQDDQRLLNDNNSNGDDEIQTSLPTPTPTSVRIDPDTETINETSDVSLLEEQVGIVIEGKAQACREAVELALLWKARFNQRYQDIQNGFVTCKCPVMGVVGEKKCCGRTMVKGGFWHDV